MVPATALVVASNCPSGFFAPEAHDYYYNHPSGMGWLTPLMFADGAGAAVFTSARRHPGDRHRGLLSVRYETSPDVELVSYPAGGCLHRTSAANLADHVFLMDAVKVAEVFPPLMTRNFGMLQQGTGLPASSRPPGQASASARSPAGTCIKLTGSSSARPRTCWACQPAGNGAMNGYAAMLL